MQLKLDLYYYHDEDSKKVMLLKENHKYSKLYTYSIKGGIFMNIENRLDRLEKSVDVLKEEFNYLKNMVEQQEDLGEHDWERNNSGDYMIKILYPDMSSLWLGDNPGVSFAENEKKLAEEIQVGQYMFIYITSPINKIIGIGKVTSSMQNVKGKLPYTIPFEWVIKPTSGISFKEVGLDIRLKIGDTLFSINKRKADIIIEKLKSMPDFSASFPPPVVL